MSTRRKRWLWLSLGLLLLVGAAFVYAQYRWQQLARAQGIETLHWQGLALARDGLSLQHLSYAQQTSGGGLLALRAEGVSLHLAGLLRGQPPQALEIAQLELDWQPPASTSPATADTAPSAAQLRRWAAWLPRTLTINDLQLRLPCASGTCQEQARLRLQHAGAELLPLNGELTLSRGDHRATLLIEATAEGAAILAQGRLLLDDQPRLSLDSQATRDDTQQHWRGTLALSGLPEAPWVLEWLGTWLEYAPAALGELPSDMRLGAGWALSRPATAALADRRQLSGELQLSTDLPLFRPLLDLGELRGRLDLGARASAGLWLPTSLTADLQMRPGARLLQTLPETLRPDLLHLAITPAGNAPPGAPLTLQLRLEGEGASPATLQAQLQVETGAAEPGIAVENARLQLRSPHLAQAPLDLRNLQVDLRLHGRFAAAHSELSLAANSRLRIERLAAGTLLAQQLDAELAGLQLQFGATADTTPQLRLYGPASLRLVRLQQPQLVAQGWQWNGRLDLDANRLRASGALGNAAGLALNIELEQAWNGALQIDGKLPEVFLRAGNPLAGTLADWPTLLQLDSGRLQADGRLTVPAGNAPLAASLALRGNGLAGIYDRTELSGLDLQLALSLARQQLRLELPELQLQRANPGFEFGPLRLRGDYQADLTQPAQGRLSWQLAETRLFDGRLWLQPGNLDLAGQPQPLQARLEGLQLPALLAAYPTEGLSGSGILDGSLQLRYLPAGLVIDDGQLAARAPGGVLRFQSPKIDALGQANPAMKIVADALHDFHYDLLASDVRYDANGKLDLGLRLHGRNPGLEGGRPINFSINLEEDIPALLTSLQLSDRVSETIQRRVRERLQ
ncbi:dicarboxylate transport [Pseudomonas sp. JL972]|uniref:YdbH domain-containing protein n=1 Tax=Stutzerimonas degradans TaxID=2968968 RepID=UPI0012D9DBCF|nr:YdbH domain-containing protein [Stutzerimonas degradans]MTZ12285.1 dicarboxylate transport [Stutzerimonas degradans]